MLTRYAIFTMYRLTHTFGSSNTPEGTCNVFRMVLHKGKLCLPLNLEDSLVSA